MSAEDAPPAAVVVAPATIRDLRETASFSGRVTAIDRVDVVARVTGFLDERLFVEGAVSTGVMGGMLAATVVGVRLIPALYVLTERRRERRRRPAAVPPSGDDQGVDLRPLLDVRARRAVATPQ